MNFTQILQPGDTLTVTVPTSGNPPPPTGGPAPLPNGVHLTLQLLSTHITAAAVAAYLTAQQAQITQDFSPLWGGSAVIDETPGGWLVELLDRSDVQGALGYHDVDAHGKPYAKVFLHDSAAAGVAWQSVASHEVLEMLADSNANTTDPGPDGCDWYQEVGDPVEDQSYHKDGVVLSDFALPAWWVKGSTGPWDFLKVLHGPFAVTPGGYAVKVCNGQVVQIGLEVERSVDRAYP